MKNDSLRTGQAGFADAAMVKPKKTMPQRSKASNAKLGSSGGKTMKAKLRVAPDTSKSATSRCRAGGSASRRRLPDKASAGWRRLVKALAHLGFLACIWAVGALAVVLAYEATQLPDISNLQSMTRPGEVRLVSADGAEFASYGAQHGRPIQALRLPADLINALLATEDRRFHSHFGVDPLSVLRAVYVNLRAGSIRQGGSTLTQQLAKNLFLNPARSLERKLQEMLLAFWLEASFSKPQILTIYLNRVYFGSGSYGIGAAARKFFGKPAEKLGLYQSALLVGLLKAPTRYNPIANPGLSAKRTRQVLLNMVDADFLDQAQADAASAKPAPIQGTASVSRGHRYFAYWALDRAADYTGPMNADRTIHTTLDLRLQLLAEAAVKDGLSRVGKVGGARQAAMVVIGHDGAVLAMVGGRNHAESQFNRATQALRQPGSAFKPLVYLAALSVGYGPSSMIQDTPLEIGGWAPRNFDSQFRGPVTLRQALAASLNVATVRLSEAIGRPRTIALARQLGITAGLNDEPSLALGAGEVTVLELTAAYVALANGGYPVKPYGIASVSTLGASAAYRHRQDFLPPVAASDVMIALDGMLQEVIRSGTGRQAAIGQRAAGKTGTSQKNRDAWFIGYAGALVAGVWVGRDDAAPMEKVTGGGLPAQIWSRFMRGALAQRPDQAR
jgi:penicillin-binding protein 1A